MPLKDGVDGAFEQVERERLLVHTFHFRSDRGTDEPPSLVRIEFTARGDRTEAAAAWLDSKAGYLSALDPAERGRCLGLLTSRKLPSSGIKF